MRGAVCGTDHRLVRAKLKLRIMRKSRYQGVKVPKRIDVSKLQDSNVREDLQKALEDEQYDGTWDKFKTEVYNASVAVLGLRKRKHRDWFDENDPQISKLLEDKNKMHQQYLIMIASLYISLLRVQNRLSSVAYVRRMKTQW